MRKGTRIVKRLLALFLVVLMSIESFAAVVSDNDGSAFITKAEFDSLKNNFQAQIDQYNTSIDSKIDGAIASYLAGIDIKKEEIISPIVPNFAEMRWKNDMYFKIKKYTFTGTRTWTNDSSHKWQTPTFGQFRNLRCARYYMNGVLFSDILTWSFYMDFWGDSFWINSNCWKASGEAMGYEYNNQVVAPLVIRCLDRYNGQPMLDQREEELVQLESYMADVAYPGTVDVEAIAAGDDTNWRGNLAANAVVGNNGGFVNLDVGTDNLIRYRIYWYLGSDYNNRNSYPATRYQSPVFFWPKDKNQYGQPAWRRMETVEPGDLHGTAYNLSTTMYANAVKSYNQSFQDNTNFKYMMLGDDSNLEVNVALETSTPGPTAFNRTYDYSDAALKEITFDGGQLFFAKNNGGWNADFRCINSSGTRTKCKFALPIWPQYYLKNLYNPYFKTTAGVPLQIGAGLPIATEFSRNGTLEIKMKYSVIDSDLDSTGAPNQKIKISCKKSNFINASSANSDYFTEENGTLLQNASWTPTDASDPDWIVKIQVKKGESMWLRIGPDTATPNGYYAKISQMDVKLTAE